MATTGSESIAGRYRLREQLGRGGMGVVWRARDERLERDVAVKILHPWIADDPELRKRFEREASALARLEHPNVVRLYDVVEDKGRTALVMELVEGESLAARVSGRKLSWDEARTLVGPVAAGLAHAHARGVVHRDLTPANVLVERGTGRLVVSDFGLARLARSSSSIAPSGVLAGTPEYWSPEQAAGRDTGPETDVYALGVILFRLLTGSVPFAGEDRLASGLQRIHEDAPALQAVQPDAPREAAALVDSLLARDRGHRPTATAAARALGANPASLPGRATEALSRVVAPHENELTLALETKVLWPGEDELPTVFSPTPSAQLPVPVTGDREQTSRHRARTHRRRRAAAVVLVTGALVGLGGGVYAVASDPPPGIDAPDVVGDGVDAARDRVTELAGKEHLAVPRVKVVDRTYSESVPFGHVLAQDPAPGRRIGRGGALLVSVSRGSAYTDVPSVTGLESAAAAKLLERAGFVTERRFAPSTELAAWHAIETEPAAGTRVKRPATVTVIVSTGPPKVPIPSVRGLDSVAAAEKLRAAGFVPVVEEKASAQAAGSILGLRPASGTRTPVGSTVTIVVAREPVWTVTTELTGEGSSSTGPITIPAGSRLSIETDDTSFLNLAGATVAVSWSGDAEGSVELNGGDSVVILDAAGRDRTVEVSLTVDGPARWRIVVESAR